MSAERLLSRLESVKQAGAGRWFAKCPAHEDRSASLSIRELEDGRILLNDFAGFEKTAILGAIGLSMSDLYPQRLGEFRSGHYRHEPPPITRAALRALSDEVWLVLVAAYNVQMGVKLTAEDFERLHLAHNRLAAFVGEFQ